MKTLKIEDLSNDPATNLALDTIKLGKQALVFVSTRPSAEKTAEDISRKIKQGTPEQEKLALDIIEALPRPTTQCERLAACAKKGIAFHHSGLTHEQKSLIENAFRLGVVKIIACTPTLAAGVDLPAYRAIIRDLKRFSDRGMNWIAVLEYLQMAGRAGRPKFDSEGQAIIIASTESEGEKLTQRYIYGEPEDIYSKLAVEPVLRVYVLSTIASHIANTRKGLHEFFMRTFWGHQFRDSVRLGAIIDKMIALLQEWEFVKTSGGDSDFRSALELDDEKIQATEMGRRVSELYLDPLTAHEFIMGLEKARTGEPLFPLLHLISFTLEMRPLLRVKAKEQDDMHDALLKRRVLMDEPSLYDEEFDDFLNAVKTALFFEEWTEEKDEEYLLEKYNVRPGEIRAKLDTADWLLYATHELARMQKKQSILKDISKTRVRLRYGAKEELLALLRLKGIGRVRARKLFNNRIRDIGDVKAVEPSVLKGLLGEKIALDIKKQVQDVKRDDKEQFEILDYDELKSKG